MSSTRGEITRLTKSAKGRAETLRKLRNDRAQQTDKARRRAMMDTIKTKVAELKAIRAEIKHLREARKAALAARTPRPASARPAKGRPSLAGRPRDARGRLLPTGGAKTPRAKAKASSARISRKYNADKLYDSKGRVFVYGPPTKAASLRRPPVRAPVRVPARSDYRTLEELDLEWGPVPPPMPAWMPVMKRRVPRDPTKRRVPRPGQNPRTIPRRLPTQKK